MRARPRGAHRKEIGRAKSIDSRVDHTIPEEEAVFTFGPEMKPILEADLGEVVTYKNRLRRLRGGCSNLNMFKEGRRLALSGIK